MSLSELTVEKLGPQGDGIHLGPRGAVFLEGALPGERLEAHLFRDKMGVLRGETVRLLKRSPERQAAPCPHFHECGGCTLQHLSEPLYREWKEKLVFDALEKFEVRCHEVLPTVFLGAANRRRGTLTAVKLGRKLLIGYYPRRSDRVTDIHTCLIADPAWFALRNQLKPFLNELLSEGRRVDLFLQQADNGVDLVFTGPLGRRGRPTEEMKPIFAAITERTPIRRISWRPRSTESTRILYRTSEPLIARFGSLEVALPPAAFMQPTREGEEALSQAVLRALPAQGVFADLFSGCGTFSGRLLERGKVYAYEWGREAVLALERSETKGLRAFERDLFEDPLRPDEANRYDAIVLDPPRSGCPEQMERLVSSRVKTIVSVSCNPQSFARDAAILQMGRYRLQSLQIVDQFLWSHHVELVGVFTRPKAKFRPKGPRK